IAAPPSVFPAENSSPSDDQLNGAPPERPRKSVDIQSIALTGLFVLAIFYTMYFMRGILLPLVLRQPIQNVAKASGEIEKLATADSQAAKPVVEVKQHPIINLLYVRGPEL